MHLESLAFRLRMDRILSNALQMQIMHDLLLQPALALIQTLLTFAPQGLQATQEVWHKVTLSYLYVPLTHNQQAIDSAASGSHHSDPVLLAAVHRYAQAANSVPSDERSMCTYPITALQH